MKSPITTHVLDTGKGRPASGVQALLEIAGEGNVWKELAKGVTDREGRIMDLLPRTGELSKGIYRLTFNTGAYYRAIQADGFYPSVSVMFEVKEQDAHYHIPLLLSPYGYSTYRGS